MNKITEGTGLIDHYIFRKMVYFILKVFKFKNIHPNYIVLFNFVFAVFCFLLIISKYYIYAIMGSFLFIFFDMFDLLDGAVARVYNKTSKFGAFFDGLMDVVSEILILLAVGFYFNFVFEVLLLLLFVLFVIYFSMRVKDIYQIKERQLNIFDVKKNTFIDKIKYLIILCTRNDSRKIILCLGIVLGNFYLIFVYWGGLYVLALLNSISVILKEK